MLTREGFKADSWRQDIALKMEELTAEDEKEGSKGKMRTEGCVETSAY